MRKSFLALLASWAWLLAGALPALSDETLHREPVPAWAEVVPLPGEPSDRGDQHKLGISHLVYDSQVEQREHGFDRFERYAYRIVERPGLEAGARISLDFDPTSHRVSLHRIVVLRDGTSIDHLDAVEPYLYKRERDAERGIFDGWMTVSIDLKDVRVGDIVDYAWTVEARPSVGADLYHERFATAWETPLGLLRKSIAWDAARPLHIRVTDGAPAPQVSTVGSRTIYRWSVAALEPVRRETNLPPGHPSRPQVEIASTDDWAEIADAVADYYRPTDSLPPEFASRIDRIAATIVDPGERMIAAKRLVQDEIRYVSLSIGAGSHVPRAPETVVESGFGDCKDKSLLLVTVLRRLGIEADAALTDTSDGRALPRMLPALGNFDHVIVKAVIDGVSYWIDPTETLQGGGADTFVEPDFGHALVLRPGNGWLEPLPSDPATMPAREVEEVFDFPRREGQPLGLRVKSVYLRSEADRMRNRLAGESLAELSEDYLAYYDRHYPGIRPVMRMSFTDDRDLNVVTIEEAYELSWDALRADGLINVFPVRGDISHDLPAPSVTRRSEPIGIGNRRYHRHTIRVSNLKSDFRGPEKVDVVTPFFLLKVLSRNAKGVFEIDWHFRTLMEEVPVAAAANYVKAVGSLKEGLYWQYDFAYDPAAKK